MTIDTTKAENMRIIHLEYADGRSGYISETGELTDCEQPMLFDCDEALQDFLGTIIVTNLLSISILDAEELEEL